MCDEKKILQERLVAIMKNGKKPKLVAGVSAVFLGAVILGAVCLGAYASDFNISYKEVPIESVIPVEEIQRLVNENSTGNPSCILKEARFKNYASIVPSKGQKAEIVSVEKSENAGIDVIYRLVPLADPGAPPEGVAIKFYNVFGSPVGFVQKHDDERASLRNTPGTKSPDPLEVAVSEAIKGQANAYGLGEVATEGHVILEREDKNGVIKVYTIASYGAFGFENGVFTKISGSGAIPTVMTFKKNENGVYSLLEYVEPTDGEGYVESIKELFPSRLHSQVLSTSQYNAGLAAQQEAQAAEYLKSIGRSARVSAAYVEKELPNINAEASNKLFAELTKINPLLNNYPYWLGTREGVENGIRYIYETSQSKTDDGYDLITFRKTTVDGTVVQEIQYKVLGNEPVIYRILRKMG